MIAWRRFQGGIVMKVLPLALCATLILLLPAADPMSFIGKAAAQAQEKSREALYMKCRNAVFKKYGHTALAHSGGRPGYLAMPLDLSVNAIDRCVANGGRVD
jgi:hypothetical protein